MTKIKINIKTPCQESDDRELEAQSDWCVKNIKLEIERCWSNHPRPEDQRLVYAGKLLQDEWVLTDILRQDVELNCHTIHLICRQTSFSPINKRNAATSELRQRKNTNNPQSASATELYQNIVSSNTPGASNSNTSASSINPGSSSTLTAPNVGYDQSNPWQMYLDSQSALANQNAHYLSQTPEQFSAVHQMYVDYMTYYIHLVQPLRRMWSLHNINRSIALENTPRISHSREGSVPLAAMVEQTRNARFGNQDINQVNGAGQIGMLPDIDAPIVEEARGRNFEELFDNRLFQDGHARNRREAVRNRRARNLIRWFSLGSRFVLLMLILFYYSSAIGAVRFILFGTTLYLFQIFIQMVIEREENENLDNNDADNRNNPQSRSNNTHEQHLDGEQNQNGNAVRSVDLSADYGNEEQLREDGDRNIPEPGHAQEPSWNQAACNFIALFFTTLIPNDHEFL